MFRLDAAAATDPGLERDSNEDQVFAQVASASDEEQAGLFVLCDGMGGHLGGECASLWAVETIKKELVKFLEGKNLPVTAEQPTEEMDAAMPVELSGTDSPVDELKELVEKAVQKANEAVYEYALRHPEEADGAGTTISMALVKGQQAVIANVGDSRTYLLRANKLRQITQDHSLVATLVAAGQIRPEDIYFHPQRNIIYRSLGQKDEVPVDIFVETLRAGDTLLLCSDGLWEMVREERLIAQMIDKAPGPEKACEALVQAAKTAGGEDNIGVVVVKVAG